MSSNIVDHAGRGRDVKAVMQLWVLVDEVRIEFIDGGAPAEVDLASLRMPDVMAENGRGLAIARASLRELSYHRDKLGNHWILVSRRFGPDA